MRVRSTKTLSWPTEIPKKKGGFSFRKDYALRLDYDHELGRPAKHPKRLVYNPHMERDTRRPSKPFQMRVNLGINLGTRRQYSS